MDVPIKHVIGTIALIGLVIAVGLSYSIITSYIEADVIRKQLEQISEHVALNLVEIVSLVNFANFVKDRPMMKILDLPSDLGGKAYIIKLVKVEGTDQIKGHYVQAQLATREDVYARSSLPLNATQSQIVLITDTTGKLPVTGEDKIIEYSGSVYGGTQEIRDKTGLVIEQRYVVVWGLKVNATLTLAGIGVWKLEGG